MGSLSDDLRGALLMTAAMASFTLNDTCMKAATATMPLFQAIVLRGGLTLAALAVIGWATGTLTLRIGRKDMRQIALRSLGEVTATLTFLSALKHMPLANLSAILQALPLLVTVGAALFLGERFGWRRMIAICVGLAGVLLIVRPGTDGFDRWSVVGIISVLCVVLRDLSTRLLSPTISSVTVALCAAVSVTLAGAVLSVFQGWEAVDPRSAMMVTGASLFLIAGYLTVVMAMRTGGVGSVAPFRYTGLIFAILLGWAVFGQLPDATTTMGAAIVVATGIYTFQRERRLGQPVAPVQ